MDAKLSSGHTFETFTDEERNKYYKLFQGFTTQFIRLEPGGIVMPQRYLQFERKLYNFDFVADDVLVMTFLKCGTTWMQEIIWTILFNRNLDNPEACDDLWNRSPFLEYDILSPDMTMTPAIEALAKFAPTLQNFMKKLPGKNPKDGIMLQLAEILPHPRVLKTHLPFGLFPRNLIEKCKVIYVARNPKDTLLSFQHHCRILKNHNFVGTQDEFVDAFVGDQLYWGSYGNHLKEAWQQRSHPNLHFVFYEDLINDVKGEYKKLANFLGVALSEQQLQNVIKKTKFSTMQSEDLLRFSNPIFTNQHVVDKDGCFFRKGKSGSWKGKFTAEQSKKIDAWIAENFDGLEQFQFKYE